MTRSRIASRSAWACCPTILPWLRKILHSYKDFEIDVQCLKTNMFPVSRAHTRHVVPAIPQSSNQSPEFLALRLCLFISELPCRRQLHCRFLGILLHRAMFRLLSSLLTRQNRIHNFLSCGPGITTKFHVRVPISREHSSSGKNLFGGNRIRRHPWHKS
jgi:hypothetical protein